MMLMVSMLALAAQDVRPPTLQAAPTETAAPAVRPSSGGQAIAGPPPLAPGETEIVMRVRYTVNVEGRVEGCSVVDSDAPAALQETACTTLTERARFTPKMEDGKPVAAVQEKTVRFRSGAGATPPSQSTAAAGRGDLPPGR